MPHWTETVTLTKIPIQETVEGGMWSQGLLWNRGSRESKEGGNRHFPKDKTSMGEQASLKSCGVSAALLK